MSFSKLLAFFFLLSLPAFATKQIIVLQQQTSGSQVCYKTANWYTITTGIQTQTAGSAWTGASTAENQAIQAGTILEEVALTCFPVGQDIASIKLVLQRNWTVRNGQIGGIGPGQFQGVFFDSGTGWSA